ncbi:MAG: alpha-glucuronidase, partial [Calditrichaeota bacterium]|nr:alpha-glucuronidase [Calditrichota bacterium]
MICLASAASLQGEDGHRLWLKYDLIRDAGQRTAYQQKVRSIRILGDSPVLKAAGAELENGLSGLLGKMPPVAAGFEDHQLVVGTFAQVAAAIGQEMLPGGENPGPEGFSLRRIQINGKKVLLITGEKEVGVLYGTFHFLRLLQTGQSLENLNLTQSPRLKLRLLNHWDNLDRTVERGYAGFSLWDWQKLPDFRHDYYRDYARANASLGINGTVLNNVNANTNVLTPLYLEKVAALAGEFRPYGLRVFLSIKFSAPVEIGGLETADPLDPAVKAWWQEKAREIYRYVPDFGGFLVKANSEGQPGPQGYGRTHADGANVLADALKPFGGVVMWRAFVYQADVKEDRHKQAYNEFKFVDGQFRDNVLVQVKNGAIDFQPREPFHPLFGGLPQTPLMMEFQITQEYLGFSTHLVYLGTLWEECLASDTYAHGPGTTVARVIEGDLDGHTLSGMAGVANTGTDRNWTGHLFGQANWYAFGRLAWDPRQSAAAIAREWIRMTFQPDPDTEATILEMMMASRENTVNYMTPLGLHHMMGWSHHYGPAPWIKDKHRDDWTSVYYHRADPEGIGFDRSPSGTDAVSQYHPPVAQKFGSSESCPEKYLLWFHHLPWEHRLASGKTLWEEICLHYQSGVEGVRRMRGQWESLAGRVDAQTYREVA